MYKKSASFTLIEVTTVIAILAIMIFVAVVVVNPYQKLEDSQAQRALTELAEVAKAVQLYSLDNGHYPPDVSRDIPPGIRQYLRSEIEWPEGPFPGSVYDYDNWTGQTCLDSEANGTVQIALRGVPGRNPDGSDVWAWYYPIHGKGTPHCSSGTEWNKGECVTCEDFVL